MESRLVFHGTSDRSWRKVGRGEQALYLVSDVPEAAKYAYEQAASEEAAGFKSRPVVMAVRLENLEGLEFEPDWGWSEVQETSVWTDSLEAVGSFSVRGDVQSRKEMFFRVPRREWGE